MAHRDPLRASTWALARRGRELWDQEVERVGKAEAAAALGYQGNGSMLLARDADAAAALAERAGALVERGLRARLLTASEVAASEPAVRLSPSGAVLALGSDVQIDGRRTAAWLLEQCEAVGQSGAKDRFHMRFDCNVERVLMGCCSNSVDAVSTAAGDIKCRLGVVLAAGAWSSLLIKKSFYDNFYKDLLSPRLGHLLELPYPSHMRPLSTAVMDCAYTRHFKADRTLTIDQQPPPQGQTSITFTACTSHEGTLLLGSSRQDGVLDKAVNDDTVDAILTEACTWLPDLAEVQSERRRSEIKVRVGPRPASKRGTPYIGAVPGLSGLVLAAGHEGSGLTMALATAEIVSSLLSFRPENELAKSFKILTSQEV